MCRLVSIMPVSVSTCRKSHEISDSRYFRQSITTLMSLYMSLPSGTLYWYILHAYHLILVKQHDKLIFNGAMIKSMGWKILGSYHQRAWVKLLLRHLYFPKSFTGGNHVQIFGCVVFYFTLSLIINTVWFKILRQMAPVAFILTAKMCKTLSHWRLKFGCGNHTSVEIGPFLFIHLNKTYLGLKMLPQ